MNCLFMSKFHSNYIITMKDIVREGNPILHQATQEVAVPPTKDDKETLICMMNFLKNSQDPVLAKILSNEIIASVSVKSVTVPVAVEVSSIIGGDPALTAAFVVATGILGTALGPWLMNVTKISHPLSRGLALGTISHGQGTAQAAVEGELQGAIAGVAMGLAAIVTSLIAPIIVPFFL